MSGRKDLKFRIIDTFYIAMAVLVVVAGIVLQILTKPVSNDITITGARIFFTIHMPLQDLPVTESQVNSVIVIAAVLFLCLWLTHGIAERPCTVRQHVAEWIVEQTDKLVADNMGEYFKGFSPFIGAVLGLSALSSLMTLVGLYPPTSDMNTVAGWAILVFILITYYKMKCGPLHYLKSFGDPVPFIAPLNVISEISTPVSMAFRHYGNVLSGTVVSTLVAALLQYVSAVIFGKLPGVLGSIPFLQIGLPAVLSVYFDIFSGCMQAFIFAMLTMLYVAGGFPAEDYEKKLEKKKRRIVSAQNKMEV